MQELHDSLNLHLVCKLFLVIVAVIVIDFSNTQMKFLQKFLWFFFYILYTYTYIGTWIILIFSWSYPCRVFLHIKHLHTFFLLPSLIRDMVFIWFLQGTTSDFWLLLFPEKQISPVWHISKDQSSFIQSDMDFEKKNSHCWHIQSDPGTVLITKIISAESSLYVKHYKLYTHKLFKLCISYF